MNHMFITFKDGSGSKEPLLINNIDRVDFITVGDVKFYPATKKIWCLFSVENNYDQPDYNLVAWWYQKPNKVQLVWAMNIDAMCSAEETTRLTSAVLDGEHTDWNNATYRLEEHCEGEIK